MSLRVKFSLLLSACVLLAVYFNASALSRVFASDQESYLRNLQSLVAHFDEKQLEGRMSLLYSQAEALVQAPPSQFEKLSGQMPGIVGAEIWRRHQLEARFGEIAGSGKPKEGTSAWALEPGPAIAGGATIRWLGRYGETTLVFVLRRDWIAGVLDNGPSAGAALLLADGSPLLQSISVPGSAERAPAFQRELASVEALPASASYNRKVFGPDGDHVVTLLRLNSDPPLFIAVWNPWSSVDQVVARTYRQSVGTALLALIAAVTLGILFARTLTSPLAQLISAMREIGRGNFDVSGLPGTRRHDEVGLLARSFVSMGRELERLRSELGRSERLAALGKFSASIAHAIKNPLGSILANSEIASRAMADPASVDPGAGAVALRYVREETLRTNRILVDLLKFAREGRPPGEVIDLAACLRRTLAALESILKRASVVLEASIPGESVPCRANADEIQDVVSNLVNNALDALEGAAAKTIRVALTVSATECKLTVADSGPGLSEDVRAHLFEPFFSTKAIGKGTGLGLATCHGIITRHGGSIGVESGPGGTAFTVNLPMARN